MSDKYNELLGGIANINKVDKIKVTTEQLQSLEALVISYMAIVKADLTNSEEKEKLNMVDSLWDQLFKEIK